MHIGDFGKPASAARELTSEELDRLDTVTVAGVTVRLRHPHDIPMFDMMEFARMVALGLPAKEMTTMSTLYAVFGGSVHPADFGRLRPAMAGMRDEDTVSMALALYDRWAEVPLDISPVSSDGATDDSPRQSESSAPSSKRSKRRAKRESPEEAQRRMEAVILGTGSPEESAES